MFRRIRLFLVKLRGEPQSPPAARRSTRHARVVREIPLERWDSTVGDGSKPAVGDIATVDQMYSQDGQTMHMLFCHAADGSLRWAADASESEIEPVWTSDEPSTVV